MELPPIAFPFGLANVASTYVDHVPHLFMDPIERDHVSDLYLIDLPKADRLAPIVNMIIIELHDASLSTVLEESSRSTHSAMVLDDEEYPRFPPGFGGMIFNISADEPSRDGEIEQEKAARVEWNVD